MTYLYRINGMTVASEIALIGARSVAVGEPDVVMRRGKVPQALPSPSASSPKWDFDDDRILMRRGEAGRFLLTHGREVVFEPHERALDEACATYLQDLVIGVLLHQRGGVVLHASAVEVSGKAVLFCGVSGEGKSTLAALLSTRGRGLVCDDICVVTFDAEGRPHVGPDDRPIKLTDTSIDALNLEAGRGARAPGNRIRAYVAPPKPWAGGALPLGAIYILRSRAGRPNIAPLDAAAALRALKRNAHRPALVRKSGHSARYFQATARMLRYAGVFTASRQRDLAQLPEMARVLEAHWRGAGLGHDPILATADGSTRPC